MENKMNYLETATITNISLDGIDNRDYPDFCDAYIADCDVDGKAASEYELAFINSEMPDVVHAAVFKQLF